MKKNLLSIAAVILFMFLAMATGNYHPNAIWIKNLIEDNTDKNNYIIKNDGTKIYGKEILDRTFFSTRKLKIDDQKFSKSDIKGYVQNGSYFTRLDKNSKKYADSDNYAKRVIHGKLNVYVLTFDIEIRDDNNRSHTRTGHALYLQKGDDGAIIATPNSIDAKKFIRDCPLSSKMLNMSESKILQEIGKDPDYLIKVFEIYNNNCQKVEP